MTRVLIIKFLAVIFLLLLTILCGGSFKVVPVKLFFDAGSKTSLLTITNKGDEKVTVRLDVKELSQDEKGQDIYVKTKDIMFFPKISDIERKEEERIVRIGY